MQGGKDRQRNRAKTFPGIAEAMAEQWGKETNGKEAEEDMKPNEMEMAMKAIRDEYGGDEEVAHSRMDDLMVAALRSLGYDKAMDIFDEQDKWYA